MSDNFHQIRLLSAYPIICEDRNEDLYQNAINKFESFLETKIQEYFKISNADDLGYLILINIMYSSGRKVREFIQ